VIQAWNNICFSISYRGILILQQVVGELQKLLLSVLSNCASAACVNWIGKILSRITVLFLLFNSTIQANCVGKFVNPITDICWSCLFPITIGGMRVSASGEDTENPRTPICRCPIPIPPYIRIGFPVSFWEPVRLVDVTRTPYCLVNLGGISMMDRGVQGRGSVANNSGNRMRHSFYHVHWYIYPLIYWLELLTDFICLEKTSFDVAYMTELDPLWNDDETAFILNPEAVLFGNPIAQAACAADCITASTGFPLDLLFWCGGCQGSLYPFTGTISAHVGGVQGSLLALQRMIAKLHREGLLWGYTGVDGLCDKYPMPIIRKTQYKTQMVYPIPSTIKGCHPLGRSEALWGAGKEYPYQGEDFGYLIWRKRNCCLG
jgi:conjugal transfer pilus assembly protein TraU